MLLTSTRWCEVVGKPCTELCKCFCSPYYLLLQWLGLCSMKRLLLGVRDSEAMYKGDGLLPFA